MAILIMIKSTPPWVWLLLAFLLYRGIKALSPRTMTPRRMLLPIVFFVWALVGIFFELRNLPVFAAALALGGALGWQLALRQPRASLDSASSLVHRPGSAMTLVLIGIGFSLKYALSAFLARHPGIELQCPLRRRVRRCRRHLLGRHRRAVQPRPARSRREALAGETARDGVHGRPGDNGNRSRFESRFVSGQSVGLLEEGISVMREHTPAALPAKKHRPRWITGSVLVALGLVFLLQNFGLFSLPWGKIWPIFLILAGIGTLFSSSAGNGTGQ
jgi:hypothetical protein